MTTAGGRDPDPLLVAVWKQNDEQQGALREQSRNLGELNANVRSLLEDRARASDQRAKLYAKVDGVEDKVDHVDRRLEACEGTLARIVPMVEQHDRNQQRVIGGAFVGRYAVHFGWAIVTLLVGVIVFLMRRQAQGF